MILATALSMLAAIGTLAALALYAYEMHERSKVKPRVDRILFPAAKWRDGDVE